MVNSNVNHLEEKLNVQAVDLTAVSSKEFVGPVQKCVSNPERLEISADLIILFL